MLLYVVCCKLVPYTCRRTGNKSCNVPPIEFDGENKILGGVLYLQGIFRSVWCGVVVISGNTDVGRIAG
jgi:hypothetical protein